MVFNSRINDFAVGRKHCSAEHGHCAAKLESLAFDVYFGVCFQGDISLGLVRNGTKPQGGNDLAKGARMVWAVARVENQDYVAFELDRRVGTH